MTTPTHPGHAGQFIVHHSSNMKLQHLDVLLYDVGGSSVLLITNQLLVGLDNVCQLVGQVILFNTCRKVTKCNQALSLSLSFPFSLIHTHLVLG